MNSVVGGEEEESENSIYEVKKRKTVQKRLPLANTVMPTTESINEVDEEREDEEESKGGDKSSDANQSSSEDDPDDYFTDEEEVVEEVAELRDIRGTNFHLLLY